MADIRTCKGCAKPVGDTTSHPVGEWRFCDECFNQLFIAQPKTAETNSDATPARNAEAMAEQASPETPASSPSLTLSHLAFESQQPEQKICRICEAPSATGEYVNVAGLMVCPVCYDKMMPAPKPKPTVVETPPEDIEPLVIEPVGVRNMKCTACSRRITARGAKMRDEQFYCPDCFVKLPTPT
ncbi:MAG: hypothetical protein VX589_18335 [Myxococcota bacterium]|nr:hypothetical protein [Myxococcota bacterium]